MVHGDLEKLPAAATSVMGMAADPGGDLVVLSWSTGVFAASVTVGTTVTYMTQALDPAPVFMCMPNMACPMGSGDLNGDHLSDMVVVDANNQVYIFLQNGQGTLVQDMRRSTSATQAVQAQTGLGEGTPVSALAVADLDMDGLPDLVLLSPNLASQINWVSSQSDGTFAPLLQSAPLPQAIGGPLAIDDLNGDGTPDLASLSLSDMSLVVFLNLPK